MPSVMSNAAANAALLALLKGIKYLAAFTADPTVNPVLANEVAGAGYQRQQIVFTPPGNRSCASMKKGQTFAGMPACTVTHLAVFGSASGDDMIFSVQLATPIAVPESGQLIVAVGDIAVSL